MERNILKVQGILPATASRCLRRDFKTIFVCWEDVWPFPSCRVFYFSPFLKLSVKLFFYCSMQLRSFSLFLTFTTRSGSNCFVSSHFVYSLHYNPLRKPLRKLCRVFLWKLNFNSKSEGAEQKDKHESFHKVWCSSLWERSWTLWSFRLLSSKLDSERRYLIVLVTLWKHERRDTRRDERGELGKREWKSREKSFPEQEKFLGKSGEMRW